MIARCVVINKINGKGIIGILPIAGYSLVSRKSKVQVFVLIIYYILLIYALIVAFLFILFKNIYWIQTCFGIWKK
jgi:hypothetical protein